jgi:NADH dehydrogenase
VKILVTGATGFVGRHVVHELRAQGHDVRCLVRQPGGDSTLAAWGCELVQGDVTDPASVSRAVEGRDAVVHLVSIITGSRQDFERVMEQATHDLVTAAVSAGVRRLVLMSALGTTEQTRNLVPYFHAKWEMEREAKQSGLEYVILRPSFVFGPDGGALRTFVRQVRWSPVTTVLGDGRRRLQPIWVEDLAKVVAAAVELPEAANRTFELGGPDAVTWDELYDRIARQLGKRRLRVNVPLGLARAGALVTDWLPHAPLTRDQLAMLEHSRQTTETAEAVETFGGELTPLDEQLRRTL